MSNEVQKQVTAFQKWFISILGVAVVGIFGQYGHWLYDEAQEEAQAKLDKEIMFDTPSDKLKTKNLTKAIEPAEVEIKWAKDEMVQEAILKKLDHIEKQQQKTDSIARLGVRLIYEVEQSH